MRAFPSTPAFRDATLAPGWVAAFTEGNFIATQPLATLAARKLLASTFATNFCTPLSKARPRPQHRSGSAKVLLKPGQTRLPRILPARRRLPPLKLDSALAHASTEAESQTAHRAAALRAQALLDRYGREQVLNWLRAGLPANLP